VVDEGLVADQDITVIGTGTGIPWAGILVPTPLPMTKPTLNPQVYPDPCYTLELPNAVQPESDINPFAPQGEDGDRLQKLVILLCVLITRLVSIPVMLRMHIRKSAEPNRR
jgi:hypothetical protein